MRQFIFDFTQFSDDSCIDEKFPINFSKCSQFKIEIKIQYIEGHSLQLKIAQSDPTGLSRPKEILLSSERQIWRMTGQIFIRPGQATKNISSPIKM